ncbi:MAG: twin-arginine translocase TatA/TatE family subunit [Gaiellaceae bacterium]
MRAPEILLLLLVALLLFGAKRLPEIRPVADRPV